MVYDDAVGRNAPCNHDTMAHVSSPVQNSKVRIHGDTCARTSWRLSSFIANTGLLKVRLAMQILRPPCIPDLSLGEKAEGIWGLRGVKYA
jgi:hypothetical protein